MALMNYPAASHGASEFFQVIEHGYLQQELRLAPDELARALKTIVKREFPLGGSFSVLARRARDWVIVKSGA